MARKKKVKRNRHRIQPQVKKQRSTRIEFIDDQVLIDFAGPRQNVHILCFLAIFALCHVLLYKIIVYQPQVPAWSQLHRYNFIADSTNCKSYQFYNPDNEYTQTDYTLEIRSGEYVFGALHLTNRQCNELKQQISTEKEISIWHHEFLIYQIEYQKQLLGYKKQKANMLKAESSGKGTFVFFAILIWVFFAKTLINVIIPGSFKLKD